MKTTENNTITASTLTKNNYPSTINNRDELISFFLMFGGSEYDIMRKKVIFLKNYSVNINKIKEGYDARRDSTYYYIYCPKTKNTIKASTREKLIDKLYDIYNNHKNLSAIVDEFHDYCVILEKSNSYSKKTIYEHDNIYKNHLINSKLFQIPFEELASHDFIEFFMNFRIYSKEHPDLPLLPKKRMAESVHGAISVLMNYALSNNYITTNTLPSLKTIPMQFQKTSPKEMKLLTKAERDKICEYALNKTKNTDIYDLTIAFLSQTGIRIGECKALMFDDIVKNEDGITCISISKQMVDSKGHRNELVDHIKAYAKNGVRYVPLSSYACDIIDRAREINNNEKGFIFSHISKYSAKKNLNPGLCSTTINSHIKTMFAKIGIDSQGFSSHGFRFSIAYYLYEKGIPENEIQLILGHNSCAMTKHYITKFSKKEISKSAILNASKLFLTDEDDCNPQ